MSDIINMIVQKLQDKHDEKMEMREEERKKRQSVPVHIVGGCDRHSGFVDYTSSFVPGRCRI